jgi:hypothetical protein
MITSSKHAAGPFMASAFCFRQFVRENFQVNRPYVSLWLGKTFVLPAGMYAGQVWVTVLIKQDKVFTGELQVRRMSFLKGTLFVAYYHELGCLARGSVDTSHHSFTGYSLLSSCIIASSSQTVRR